MSAVDAVPACPPDVRAGDSVPAPEARENRCPLCGAADSETLFNKGRLANTRRTYASLESESQLTERMNTDLCLRCGMLYRKPLLTADALRQYYRALYVETYKSRSVDPPVAPEAHDVILARKNRYYTKHFRFLARYGVGIRGRRILDVGCGAGWFLAVTANQNPKSVMGIEPSGQRCESIAQNDHFSFDVVNGVVSDFEPGRLGTFDLVALIGVLEHLSDPKSDLEACRKFMGHGSLLYIYTHNESPAMNINLRRRISLVHQLYFTPRTLRLALATAGLRVVGLRKRVTDMHVLAERCDPVEEVPRLGKTRLNWLKARYCLN
ncbi:MAG: class I SAM-dependent methyltransferase, partial [bacterium]|nr:class I SAM-dependent methyltransferase [bacterium]